jgi:tetratricopeptide (TPR) repeat protein
MSQVVGEELEIFYCYAREDDALRKELEIHLSGLKRTYHLKHWHDSEINPGEQWEQTINEHLDTADLIFVLISPHFLASEYCYGKEMQRALERSKQGTCRIVPILLRPTLWEDIPFSKLQLLPTDTRAITSWPDRYEAFHDVVTGISKVLKTLLAKRWYDKGVALRNLKRFDDALSAYDHAILLDPSYASPWNGKGNVLSDLKRFNDALSAYDHAILLDPSKTLPWNGRGNVLYELNYLDNALSAYEHAILLDPSKASPWNGKGNVLSELNYLDNALSAYEHAILLDPSEGGSWYNKSLALQALGRPKEAQEALGKARQLGYSPE